MKTACRIIALLLITIGVAACGGAEPGNTTNAPIDERPQVALIMKSLANEFFVTMADGARAHQAENDSRYRLIVNGIRNETDLAQQVALIDQMIASGVDAICGRDLPTPARSCPR